MRKIKIYSMLLQNIVKMRATLKNINPNIVLVHGDTTTAYATALFYLGIKVGHVEAGLRTNTINAPFQRYNRRSAGLIADYHFAPTSVNKNNLLAEGKSEESVIVTGNTVIDSLHLVLSNIDKDKNKSVHIETRLGNLLNFDWKIINLY